MCMSVSSRKERDEDDGGKRRDRSGKVVMGVSPSGQMCGALLCRVMLPGHACVMPTRCAASIAQRSCGEGQGGSCVP